MLVVQDRRILVIRHDVVVGHLLFALPACRQVAHVRIVFGASAVKRGERSRMSQRAHLTGFSQAGQFVRCLDGALVVQQRDQLLGVEALGIRALAQTLGTQVSDAAQFIPMVRGLRIILHGDEIDRGGPLSAGQFRRLVPVIVGLIEQDQGTGTRPVHQDAARTVRDGHPCLELRIHLVGVVLVVEK